VATATPQVPGELSRDNPRVPWERPVAVPGQLWVMGPSHWPPAALYTVAYCAVVISCLCCVRLDLYTLLM